MKPRPFSRAPFLGRSSKGNKSQVESPTFRQVPPIFGDPEIRFVGGADGHGLVRGLRLYMVCCLSVPLGLSRGPCFLLLRGSLHRAP